MPEAEEGGAVLYLAKAGRGGRIHHHLRSPPCRDDGGPLCRGFAFPRSLRGDTDTRKWYGNLAGGHVIYAIAACKKYSSSYPVLPTLTQTESIWMGGWMDDVIHSLSTCVNVMRRCGVYLALHSVSDSSSLWLPPNNG